MAEAMLQARKVTSPGCCGVNLGHRHSCQVIKGHGKTIHHTLSEDWPGQTQSQNSSDLAELREECLFPRKKLKKKHQKKKNPEEKHHNNIKPQFPCPFQQTPLALARLEPHTSQLKAAGKQHVSRSSRKNPHHLPKAGPRVPGVGAGTHSCRSNLGGPKPRLQQSADGSLLNKHC